MQHAQTNSDDKLTLHIIIISCIRSKESLSLEDSLSFEDSSRMHLWAPKMSWGGRGGLQWHGWL